MNMDSGVGIDFGVVGTVEEPQEKTETTIIEKQ